MKHGRQPLHMRYLIYGCAFFKDPCPDGEIPPNFERRLEDYADLLIYRRIDGAWVAGRPLK
jgi:hypothetical protein